MRLSEQWLREYVNPELSIEQLVEKLVMAGHEVVSVTTPAGIFSHVLVGEVLKVEPHPDADRLRVCQVNVGTRFSYPEGQSALQIVCGAPDVRAGLRVAVAVVGAVLPNIKIKQSRLRGVESQGMLCSEAELGLPITTDGLIELPSELNIGEDLRVALNLDDKIIEVDITPNRGDCLSVLGLAREIAALTNISSPSIPKAMFSVAKTENTQAFSLVVEAQEDCPRYCGRVIRNIDPEIQTPLWLQQKLQRSGLNTVNAVVDVTNYVLLELGQPLHAFDYTKIKNGLRIRKARTGEELRLLNGEMASLNEDTLVIADSHKPLAIAGIMGGAESAVNEKTETIFLESAFFNPLSIAGRARSYGLHTDSSYRYERGVDPALQNNALERATDLLLSIVGGEAEPIIEYKSEEHLPKVPPIFLTVDRVNAYLGFSVDIHFVEKVLTALQMKVTPICGDRLGWEVTPPSFRFDLKQDVDLIEEVLRIYGYDCVPCHYPATPLAPPPHDRTVNLSLEEISACLIAQGYQEAITYSFVDSKLQQLMDPNTASMTLLNPISTEMSVMRTHLWTGLLSSVLYNQARQQNRVRLFEVGQRFLRTEAGLIQERVLAGIITGTVSPEQWSEKKRQIDFFDLKHDVEAILQLTGYFKDFNFSPLEHPALHPGQAAEIFFKDQVIGRLGALHPQIEQATGLLGPAFVFELILDREWRKKAVPHYESLSKFPSIRRDFAVIVDQSVSAEMIESLVRKVAGNLISNFWIFDRYMGTTIEPGKVSLAFAVILQHHSQTLVDEEIVDVTNKILDVLQKELNAVLRD